jgi:hypothetical protein
MVGHSKLRMPDCWRQDLNEKAGENCSINDMHQFPIILINLPRRLILAALFSLAHFLLATTAQAQIAIQDGSPLAISRVITGGTAISQSFKATAGASVMVVILEDRGASYPEPATLTWNGQVLVRDVQSLANVVTVRCLAIYHLYNPNPGTANITGTMGASVSSCWLTAYTLSGVDTTVAPLTAPANTGTSTTNTSLSASVNGVLAGSWAAMSACLGTVGYTVTNTATSGTTTTVTDNSDDSSTANAGYVAGLSTGTDTFTSSFSGGTKACFAVAVFSPPSAHLVSNVQAFGIKFLGNTTDPVTGAAGVFRISGWNNIANASYTAGTIYSSDGSVAATLSLSGSGSDNTWNSGAFSDGGNSSLMNGYQDAGQNNPATDVISGLTGAAYDVYLYSGGDNARPSSATDYLPNYTINGTTYYTATLKGYDAILKMAQGIPTSQNANTYPTTQVAGHYIKINSVVPVGGAITITANSDNLTYRSPLNGFELVRVGNFPQVMLQPTPHRLYTSGSAQLQVQAEGANPLVYQWRQNGTNLNDGGNISGSQTTNFAIANLTLSNGGNYDVVITNSYGSVTSSVANLSVVVESQADSAFEAWIAAYVVTNGYQTYVVNNVTDRNFAFMWQQAYMIWMVEDTYDHTQSPDQKQLITALINTFMHQNGLTLTWDGWDDDLEWGEMALIRSYETTGNVVALNSAISVWNAVMSRGWDNTFGGGIWEKLPAPSSKCALSNYPQIIAGIHLFQITGQSNYLTTCENIYTWARTNIFIATSAQATNGMNLGQVNEGVAWADTNQINMKVLVSNNSYNSGLFAMAASLLYQATGNTQYLSDAILAENNKVNVEPILNEDHVANGDFGGEMLIRGAVLIASQNHDNLWPTYGPWLQAQCPAAWSERRTDLNLTHNNFTTATSAGTNNLDSMESECAVLVQQMAPASIPGFINCTNKLNGTIIGTSGSYNNQGNTIAKVFDGNLNTFFDAPVTSGAWVGLDFGAGVSNVISQINYWPRISWASRMLGGVFQGDNTPAFFNPVTLYTITVVPPDNGTVTAQPITNQPAFRCVRYVGPANGSCNVAELQFFSPNPPPPLMLLTNNWKGTQLSLNWPTGGLLLEATNVSGPWTTNASAAPPFQIIPNQPQKYYRVVAP